ncbi:MAG: hypothetical protein C4547_04260 [Phycisphaerales bacterium]|nr:MAG: hypothetical protein C4547_04260 [Phycisphaerales bacterium]
MVTHVNGPTHADWTRPPSWVVASALAAIVLTHVVGRIACYCSDIRTDSYTSAAFSYRMVHGDVLYRDMSIDKPPAIMVVNTLPYLVLPAARTSLIPMESLLMVLGYVVIYRFARTLYGPWPALMTASAAVLAINYFSALDFTGEGFALAESYLVLPQAGAALLYVHSLGGTRQVAPAAESSGVRDAERRSRWTLIGCGACIGINLAAKQTAIPIAAAVLGHVVLRRSLRRQFRLAIVDGVSVSFGVALALLPFALMLTIQGTWRQAWHDMTVQAAMMLERETGWPDTWRDVKPLWAPLMWLALTPLVLPWRTARVSPSAAASPTGLDVDGAADHTLRHGILPAAMSFLLLWQIIECILLVQLPRRSYHYYVLSFLPIVMASGYFWRALIDTLATPAGLRDPSARSGASGEPRASARADLPAELHADSAAGCVRMTILAAAVLWSLAVMRPAFNELYPVAWTRLRQFDPAADQRHFEQVVRWENGSLGRNDGRWPGE